jgi:hypothetical protein
MAEIKYRVSSSETPPVATTVKNAQLSNLEIDANFRSIQVDLITRKPGSIAERPAGVNGILRYNTDYNQFEGYINGAWGQVGGGATGANNNKIFWENDQTVSADYTLTLNKNAGSFGPITVNSGVVVTVPDGCVWTIV